MKTAPRVTDNRFTTVEELMKGLGMQDLPRCDRTSIIVNERDKMIEIFLDDRSAIFKPFGTDQSVYGIYEDREGRVIGARLPFIHPVIQFESAAPE